MELDIDSMIPGFSRKFLCNHLKNKDTDVHLKRLKSIL